MTGKRAEQSPRRHRWIAHADSSAAVLALVSLLAACGGSGCSRATCRTATVSAGASFQSAVSGSTTAPPGDLPGESVSGGTTTATAGTTTGTLVVLVVVGPLCPVERSGGPPCTRPGGGAAITVTDPAGRIVTTAIADGSGEAVLRLAAGDYTVSGQMGNGGVGQTSKPTPVHVPPGGTTTVTVTIDTGIR